MILEAIDEALRRKHLTDAAASRLAVGNPALIKNLRHRRGKERDHPIENLQKLAEVLDLEFYVGPHRQTFDPNELDLDGEAFAAVDVYKAEASAGGGLLNPEEDPIGTLAFKQTWLASQRINPARAKILRVKGDSMEPTIIDGAIVLVDEQRMDPPGVFAVVEDGELRIKRLEPLGDQGLAVLSDNPHHRADFRYGAEMNRLRIIGRVVWTAHAIGGKSI